MDSATVAGLLRARSSSLVCLSLFGSVGVSATPLLVAALAACTKLRLLDLTDCATYESSWFESKQPVNCNYPALFGALPPSITTLALGNHTALGNDGLAALVAHHGDTLRTLALTEMTELDEGHEQVGATVEWFALGGHLERMKALRTLYFTGSRCCPRLVTLKEHAREFGRRRGLEVVLSGCNLQEDFILPCLSI